MSLPLNVFAGLSLTLDRIAERRDDPAWVQALANQADARFIAIDENGETWLLPGDRNVLWLTSGQRLQWLPTAVASLLGLIEEVPYFLLRVDMAAEAARLDNVLSAPRRNLRQAGISLSATEASLFAYARALAHWQRETRHCSHCGQSLNLIAAGHRGQCPNTGCGRMHFPRTDAAVIVIVEHQGCCLLGRQQGWPPGRFSTLAGFVEPGESLEDAVRREVAEEAGVQVDQVRYHSSQPWPMPASLMLGFRATATTRTITLRDGELEEARWFSAEQIANGIADGSFVPSMSISISYRLLADWLAERAGMDLDALVAAHSKTGPGMAR